MSEDKRGSLDLNFILSFDNPNQRDYSIIAEEFGELQRSYEVYMFTRAYAEPWLSRFEQNEDLRRLFQERLSGKTLIDLACGVAACGTSGRLISKDLGFPIPTIAKESGAEAYIGVDLRFHLYDIIEQGLILEGNEDIKEVGNWNVLIDCEVDHHHAKSEDCVPIYNNGLKNILDAPSFQKTFNPSDYFSPMDMALIQGDMLTFLSSLQPGEYSFTINGVDRDVFPPYVITEKYCEAVMVEIERLTEPGSLLFMRNSVFSEYLDENRFRRIEVPSLPDNSEVYERI